MKYRLGLVSICVLSISACRPTGRPNLLPVSQPLPVQYQDDAARVGLAVVSVAPWDDYAATLQPIFALTAEQALAQAMPTTNRQTSDLIDALAIGLKLAPPTSARSSTSTRTTTDGVTTSERTATSTRQPGDVSAITLPDAADSPAARKAASSVLDQPLESGGPSRYAAATALFQEVQLLNSYVRDAALARGKQAFVVRLQVSLVPRLRGQAYDAYTTLSFLLDTPAVVNPYARNTASGTQSNRGVTVLPILVTDSLEQSLAEVSASRNREFALGLAALLNGFGVSADVARTVQQLQSALGAEDNALQTVTKVAGNSLRVRFGAQQQIATGLAMVPRNHTVTAVVLVDAPTVPTSQSGLPDPTTLTVLSKTEVVNATNGQGLFTRPLDDFRQGVDKILSGYLPAAPGTTPPPPPLALSSALMYAAMSNRRDDFNTAADTLQIDQAARGQLWVDLVDLGARSAYALTSFELPSPAVQVNAIDTQAATVFDDGKSATIRLRGLRGLDASQLSAYLTAGPQSSVLPGEVTAVTPGVVDVTFPSPLKLGLCAAPACAVDVAIYRNYPPNRWNQAQGGRQVKLAGAITTTYANVAEDEPDPPKAKFSLTVGARQIVRSRTGAGTVLLMFKRGDGPEGAAENMFFTLSGADVVSATPANAVSYSRYGWKVNAPAGAHAAVTLTLANLADDVDVTITANNGPGKATGAPITLRVRTAPPIK